MIVPVRVGVAHDFTAAGVCGVAASKSVDAGGSVVPNSFNKINLSGDQPCIPKVR
jgi:hypothetical protein